MSSYDSGLEPPRADRADLDPASRASLASPSSSPTFHRVDPVLGAIRIRPLRFEEDLPIVHSWVTREYARYWGMAGFTLPQVAEGYREIARTAEVYLGSVGEVPAFLVETYAPEAHEVGAHYAVQEGDRGMHVLVAPPASAPIPGFTWAVFRAVMEMLFAQPAVHRVVVEPDIRNGPIHALNRKAGFRYQKAIQLSTKTGHLAFCTRAQFTAAMARLDAPASPVPRGLDLPARSLALPSHLRPDVWAAVNAALCRKLLSELAHERVLAPIPESLESSSVAPSARDWAWYHVDSDDGSARYGFRARLLELDHWDLETASLLCTRAGKPVPLDAVELVLDCKRAMGLPESMLRVYLEEILCTLYSAAFKHANQRCSSADLVHASFQEIEAAMSEGHPVFIANNGRVGFDAGDYALYAPEAGQPVRLLWVASHRRHTEVSTLAELRYEDLLERELGAERLAGFRQQLSAQGLDPAAYLFIPLHPWQWANKLAMLFAPDLAARALVVMGESEDRYQAQQSIRTFANLDHPERCYVKVALSILNMGFMRGLSADYMKQTPGINDWVAATIDADPVFAEHGFAILREIAGIGYRNPYFEAALPKGSAYRKMLAALWRESPIPTLQPGQRVMTMAALLHRDRDGVALLPQLILASGLPAEEWIDALLRCYFVPLVHAFFRYEMVFMPHGENFLLVMEGSVPRRALLKDIAEEVAVMDPSYPLPDAVKRIAVEVPDQIKALSIFTDIFDCIFRYVAQILEEQADYPAQRFWRRVAEHLLRYQAQHPELAAQFARYDLFAPEFQLSCLNRLQLHNNQQMVDLADPAGALRLVGTLVNPIAGMRVG
jgi:siderophore synthetase component